MDSVLWTALILCLAAASGYSVVFSWPNRKEVIAKTLALVTGVVVCCLQMGMPQGLSVGLAAGAAGPIVYKAFPKLLEKFGFKGRGRVSK